MVSVRQANPAAAPQTAVLPAGPVHLQEPAPGNLRRPGRRLARFSWGAGRQFRVEWRRAGGRSGGIGTLHGRRRHARLVVLILAIGLSAGWSAPGEARPVAAPGEKQAAARALQARLQAEGTLRLIVRLNASFIPEGRLSGFSARLQREGIERVGQALAARLSRLSSRVIRRFEHVPLAVVSVDAAGLEDLVRNPDVVAFQEDGLSTPSLQSTIQLIGADDVWAAGYTGAGQVVAILDTGVDGDHPFLAGKVIGQACFSTTNSGVGATSLCPNGQEQQIGGNAGINCSGIDGCDHGTHVAGIAAGQGVSFSGVARGADLLAVQVFTRFSGASCTSLGLGSPCVLSYDSDQIAALDWLFDQSGVYTIAAANLSLGGQTFAAPCDSDLRKPVIDNLRSAGVATVIASGNDGARNAISAPGCISTAVSVGSATDSGQVSSFSNVASFLSLLAPGSSVTSSVPGDGFETWNGTSMAAPHVAGAFALLRSRAPSATVDQLLGAMSSTGVLISDTRSGGSVTRPRIQLDAALAALEGMLTPTSTPTQTATSTSTPTATQTATATATATITPTATATPIFADVPASHWAAAYIEALYQAGYVVGCQSTPVRLYCPDRVLNRAESAVFVERGEHGALTDPPYPAPSTPTFSDVAPSFWGFGWIESLWSDEFTAGCLLDPLSFCPERQHTRAEGSVFFLRIKNGSSYSPPDYTGIFADVSSDDWYADWVEAAYQQGIMPACQPDPLAFCPNLPLDRAWAAYSMVQAKGIEVPTP